MTLSTEWCFAYPTGIVLTDEGQKLVISATEFCGQSERMAADLLWAAPTQGGELKVLIENIGMKETVLTDPDQKHLCLLQGGQAFIAQASLQSKLHQASL